MIKNISIILSMVLASTSFAYELKGNWIIDVDSTIKYNALSVGMSELRKDLLKCSVANTVIVITSDSVKEIVASHKCSHKDKNASFDSYEHTYGYEIIYNNNKQTVVLNSNKLNGEHVDIINWLDKNTFWIDFPEENFSLRRVRYFYIRSGIKH